MNKSVLKQIVHSIVGQKILEAKGIAPKYGYVMSGKGTEDPIIQMIGYGNMPLSQWMKKVQSDAEDLLEEIKKRNWHNAAYLVKEHSILLSEINMLDEILTDKNLKEDLETNPVAAANPPLTNQTAPQKDASDLDKYSDKVKKISDDIKKIESEMVRREEPVRMANHRDQLKISRLKKQQGPLLDKIESLKKKTDLYQKSASVTEGDESDYYSPEAKAARADAKKSTEKRPVLGARVYNVGLHNTKDAMTLHGLVKTKQGKYVLPYYQGDDDKRFKENMVWLDKEFGNGSWTWRNRK